MEAASSSGLVAGSASQGGRGTKVRGLIRGKRDVPLKGAGAVGHSRAVGSLGTSSGAGPGAWEGDAIGKRHVAAEGGAAGSITVTCGGGGNVASWTGAGAVGAIESSQGDRFSVAMEPAGSEIGLAGPGSGFVSLWAVSSCLLALLARRAAMATAPARSPAPRPSRTRPRTRLAAPRIAASKADRSEIRGAGGSSIFGGGESGSDIAAVT